MGGSVCVHASSVHPAFFCQPGETG